ncbi:MAG: valine--pyruvate transaminase [Kiritimatiellae bacterium]|nr:valine--pyruvate transaminase [Kiritimatiellia bacterium]
MQYSVFGEKFRHNSGITQLMDDLGAAMAAGDTLMLGGGNPAHIPAMQQQFRELMESIMRTPAAFERMLGNYDGTRGNAAFIEALVELMNTNFGWNITPRNVVLTNGSQSAFFYLFNLFAGAFPDGSHKKILLPLTPEYIGYTDTGLGANFFQSYQPTIRFLEERMFKYHVDFNALRIGGDIGAICVSRPTNPTGNVLTDEEMCRLDALARAHGVPLIIDNAYGTPFPNIIFSDAAPLWNPNTVVCMSLSKLGLPNLRTGIVIAHEDVATALAEINGVMHLAPGGVGARLALELVRSGEIITLSREVVRPFYQRKAEQTIAWLHEELGESVPWRVHKPEGALFLWLWFEGLPCTSAALYEQLKARGCLVVSGHNFFAGQEDAEWPHKHECIRVTYAQDEQTVRQGIKVIADEVRRCWLTSLSKLAR